MSSLCITYGVKEINIDVTRICLNIFMVWPDKLVFPIKKDFNNYFGDPVPGHRKYLTILYQMGRKSHRFTEKSFQISEVDENLIQICLSGVCKKNVIYVCHIEEWLYFRDLIDTLPFINIKIYYQNIKEYNSLINQIETLKQYVDDDNNIIIFANYINIQISPQNNVYIFNTEQLSVPKKLISFMKNINKQGCQYGTGLEGSYHNMLDYSISNIKIVEDLKFDGHESFLSQNLHDIKTPTRFDKYWLLSLPDKSIQEMREEIIYDVGIVNISSSKKRQFVYDQLKSKGVNVINIMGFDLNRDRTILQCKILLNIHYHDDYIIFEHIRCDRWVFHPQYANGERILISEISQDQNLIDIKDLVIWSNYDDIVETVIRYLEIKSYPKYDISKVVIEREKQLSNLVQKFDQVSLPMYENDNQTIYQKWLICLDQQSNKLKRSFIKYVSKNYIKINRNGITILIPKNHPNIEYWKKDFTSNDDIISQYLNIEKIILDIGQTCCESCIYLSKKCKHLYIINSEHPKGAYCCYKREQSPLATINIGTPSSLIRDTTVFPDQDILDINCDNITIKNIQIENFLYALSNPIENLPFVDLDDVSLIRFNIDLTSLTDATSTKLFLTDNLLLNTICEIIHRYQNVIVVIASFTEEIYNKLVRTIYLSTTKIENCLIIKYNNDKL